MTSRARGRSPNLGGGPLVVVVVGRDPVEARSCAGWDEKDVEYDEDDLVAESDCRAAATAMFARDDPMPFATPSASLLVVVVVGVWHHNYSNALLIPFPTMFGLSPSNLLW